MNTRLLVALGLCVVLQMFAFAESAQEDPAVLEIIALEERWIQAESAHDTDALWTILDEGMFVVSDSGVRTREEFIASVTKGPVDPTQTQTITDRKVRVEMDAAVSTEIDTVHATRDGKPVDYAFRCTTTYIRRDSRWRAIAEVFSKVPAPK